MPALKTKNSTFVLVIERVIGLIISDVVKTGLNELQIVYVTSSVVYIFH